MQGKYRLEDELSHILASTNDEDKEDRIETLHIYIVSEGEEPDNDQIIESTIVNKKPDFLAYATFLFGIVLTLSCLSWSLLLAVYPLQVTVTLIPKEQIIATTATLQLVTTSPGAGQIQGRALPEITLSESRTIPTTAKGYQTARHASGLVTFYNGQFSTVTIPAGTVLAGSDGTHIVTDQVALIPPGNPPTYGHKTVSAYAVTPGAQGNIAAYDINTACCAASVLAKNTSAFTGGEDARQYHAVATADVSPVAITLKTTLAKSVQGALLGQLHENKNLLLLPCSPLVSLSHQIGEDASTVTVSVSETCTGIAYDMNAILAHATQVLSALEKRTLGTGYNLLGAVQVTNLHATTGKNPTLTYSCKSTWIYGIDFQKQQHMKQLIAGKLPHYALRALLALSGIESAAIGGDDTTKLPKDFNAIHFTIITQNG